MDVIFDLLLNNSYVPWLVIAVVGLVVYQKFSHKVSVRVPGSGLTKDDVLSKVLGSRWSEGKLERQVAKEKKAGNFLAAGKILEDMDRLPQAAEVYLQGQEFWAAASTFEKLGKGERAAELFLQAGDYKKAAALLTQAGKHAKAAVLFQEKGNNLEAARLYGLAGNWDKAADLYSKSGYPLRAAEAFEKQGAFIKAAEAYEKHFMENVSYSTTYSSTASTGETKSALLAGRLYEKGGDLNRAYQAYNKGSFFKEAAGALGKLGQHAKAAEMFLRAEDHESAAKAYEAAGDPVKAANLLGEVAYKSDKAAEAAAHFVRGRDFLRAAELYESVGMLAEAAGAYETGESWAAAGNVYVRAGLKGRAAAAYERAGEFDTSAKLYEEAGNGAKAIELFGKAGQTFKSGEAAAKAGDHQNAIALLQRVGASDENYRTATELLAQLFITTGMPQLAIERVQKTIAGQPISAANLDLYYWLAVALESSGNGSESLSVYKKIQAEDLQFRDVNQRVVRIETGGPLPAASVPATPAFGTPAFGTPATPAFGTPATPAFGTPAFGTPVAAPHAASAPTPRGQRFSRKEEIGRGPLGVVHRAEDQTDGRSVALRALPAEALKGEGVLQALVADLKAAAQVSHPNVVKILGMVEVQGERCLVTELVAGKNFAEALKAGRRMTFQQVHGLGRVLAQSLSVIHGRGLVHGSIQPSNIMVAAGVIKIADLGLGRLAHRVSAQGDYRAPESQLDAAGDLYASAAVLYHLLTGTHPRSQPQGVGLPLPSKLSPGVPEAIDKLLLRCLHPRQELRFATADELLAELKDMVKIG
jgi:serine/threonine-protein kinase